MRASVRLIIVVLVGSSLFGTSGCSEEDTTAPAPPLVDRIELRPGDGAPILIGTAEFGAVVRVTGGAVPAEVTADPYTAKFAVAVELSAGNNSLQVVAIDAAGNESEPTVVEFPGAPKYVVVAGPSSVRAGEIAEFEVSVYNERGEVIPSAEFTLSTDAPAGTTSFEAPGRYTFCDVGRWTVTAAAGASGPSATAEVVVSAGYPAVLSLATEPTPAVIAAGDTITYQTSTLDSCGNQTSDVVAVTTNAPGALAADGLISGLVRAGSYVVMAELPGTGLVDTVDLLVGADQGSTAVSLALTTHSTAVGVPVGYTVIAVDGFGNPITTAPVITAPTDAGAVIDPVTRTVEFSEAGNHTLTASVNVASDSDFVVVTDPDIAFPSVSVTSPLAGALVEPGTVVEIVVEASDDKGLAQVAFQATGARERYSVRIVPAGVDGAAQTSYSAVFELDVGGGNFGDITLVGQAVDTAGNITTSIAVVIRADPAAGLITGAGFTVQTVSYRGRINGPRGVTVTSDGQILIANNGDGVAVVEVTPSSGAQTTLTPTIGGCSPEDVAYFAGDGTALLACRGDDVIYRIETSGIDTLLVDDVGDPPAGLSVIGTDLYVLYRTGRIRRFDATASPLATAQFTADADPPLNGSAWGLAALGGGEFVATDNGDDDAWQFSLPAASGNAVTGTLRIASNTRLDQPRGIVVGPSGRAYIASSGDGRIIEVDLAGCTSSPCPSTVIASGFERPWGLALDGAAVLYVTDESRDVLYRVTGAF